jgi:hypothetical protein
MAFKRLTERQAVDRYKFKIFRIVDEHTFFQDSVSLNRIKEKMWIKNHELEFETAIKELIEEGRIAQVRGPYMGTYYASVYPKIKTNTTLEDAKD